MFTPLTHWTLAAAAVAMAAMPSMASAQLRDWDEPPGPVHVDISASAGWLTSTDWSDLVLLGNIASGGGVEQVIMRDLNVDPGLVLDAAVTYWEGRAGLRVHGGFAESCLAVGRTCGDPAGGASGTVGVNSYQYDVGAAIGLLPYTARRPVWPYVFFGIGGITYDLGRTVGPPLSLVVSGAGSSAALRRPSSVILTVEELGVETRLALNFGIGTDLSLPLGPAGLGVRLEVSDLVHESPIHLSITQIGGLFDPQREEIEFGPVHNIRASAGIVLQFGRARGTP